MNFVHFQTKAEFNNKKSQLSNDDIIFIKDTKEIRTHDWSTQEALSEKANIEDLSNVLAEEVLDENQIFEDDSFVTREEFKKDLFIDIWNTVCGSYGKYDPINAPDEEHPFLLNDIYLTYEQALMCYKGYCNNTDQSEAYSSVAAISNIPMSSQWSGTYTRFAQNNTALQTVVIPRVQVGSLMNAFYGCTNLRNCYIKSMINVTSVSDMFVKCYKLENLKMKILNFNLNLSYSPLLTSESFRYMISNAGNTSAVTITVHPDVYAKLTGDTTNATAAALSEEELAEWMALLSLATEKNIQFATTT